MSGHELHPSNLLLHYRVNKFFYFRSQFLAGFEERSLDTRILCSLVNANK